MINISRYVLRIFAKLTVVLSLILLISACQSEEDTIQSGYWVENDAENSLVKFSPGGKFINVRNPNSTVNYEIDGGYMMLGESEEKIKLKIKKADDMQIILDKDGEEFIFFKAAPADYFYGIWQGIGESISIELSFAKKNNGYLTVMEDTLKHSEPFSYQIIRNNLIIYKQDKDIDTLTFEFEKDLNKLELINNDKKQNLVKKGILLNKFDVDIRAFYAMCQCS